MEHTKINIIIKSHLSFQEHSQLPATMLLAQHKVRAAKLETQIEQQKQAVKPTSLFSTGINMVSQIHSCVFNAYQMPEYRTFAL